MKVFLTGGSGFVGQEIIKQLIAEKHEVRVLIRSPDRLNQVEEIDRVIGDTTRPETLKDQLSGCDAVIHLVGIIREFRGRQITFQRLHVESTQNILQAAQEQGVRRYIHMSANGTGKQAVTSYHRTKWAAEEKVHQANLDWTVFRPSLIFGPQDMFVNMLARMIKILPIMPVMGDGQYQLQPVHVTDVAKSFVAALTKTESIGQTYPCCGQQTFSYNEILDLIGKALGLSRVRKVHQPLWLMKPIVGLLQSFPLFPLTSDQLQMLLDGNICQDTSWASTFGLELIDFNSAIEAYVK